MTTKHIKIKVTPEEEELHKYQKELSLLEIELAQQELELATYQAELISFESKYMRVVGVKYAKLDKLEEKIAELLLKKNPDNFEYKQTASKAKQKYNETARAVGDLDDLEKSETFKPSDSLKNLYRELARKVHPDLSTDKSDQERRNRIMAEVNKAYREGNEERLLEILQEWESNPESIKGEGIGVELVKTIRKISQIKKRLEVILEEIADLKKSELFSLKIKVENAFKEGRDLLVELTNKIEKDIIKVEERLQKIS